MPVSVFCVFLGILIMSCENFSAREKCKRDNTCESRAQMCFESFSVVRAVNQTPTNEDDAVNMAVTCSALKTLCEKDCNLRYLY
ncbi:hypothetical protein EHQ17_12375 [Leptospira gomenensis]|uniref:Cys-rich protein n=1 Tax=Leptospira gomenensis TaxID=2484974 RepID=A0A5F1Y9S0_9LEPT|nr:hypothetical protein [Leptospira gomenensis]TGK32758.1 hypothetical protein EHQ17_12375 [Leptospira gomenensis]TGK44377.1 hypothetical protein EHQ07_11845 [Leptospira gomenensis]